LASQSRWERQLFFSQRLAGLEKRKSPTREKKVNFDPTGGRSRRNGGPRTVLDTKEKKFQGYERTKGYQETKMRLRLKHFQFFRGGEFRE